MKFTIKAILPERWFRFLLFILITIIFTYFVPREFAFFWAVIVLASYYRSRDEAFWLAFFLVTTDGFMSFFGMYNVTLQILPGLPSIELVQFYFLLSLIKAFKAKERPYVFYKKYLVILLCYLVFLVIWGQFQGFEGELNVYFRIAKLILPMILFFSIPRLFPNLESYQRLFSFLFLILIVAFATQLFTLLTGFSPGTSVKFTEEEMAEPGHFRGFYNAAATLLGLFGALFFLAVKKIKTFSSVYLYVIIVSAFGMAYLSASRGWTIFFSIVIISTFMLSYRLSIKRMVGISVVFTLVVFVGLSNPVIKKQSEFSIERLDTMKLLASGDVTAGHTLARLDVRAPRVMKIWAENPVFGWGFSDTFLKFQDGHVGNQNILLFSGVVGFVMLIGFLVYFCLKMILRSQKLPPQFQIKRVYLVFILYLLGWFFLHSTGAQHFGYYGLPIQIIPQAVFFSLGALLYAKPSELSK